MVESKIEHLIAELIVSTEKTVQHSFAVTAWEEEYPHSPAAVRLIYNHIILIGEGTGSLQIDDTPYPVEGNDLFLAAKGQVVQFPADLRCTGYDISFGDCFWERAPASANNCKAVLFNNVTANQHLPLSAPDAAEMVSLLAAIYQEFSRETYINQLDALAAYLKIIMIKTANINALLSEAYDSHERKMYRDFLELVGRQYASTREVAVFADRLGIPARKLTEVCKRVGGKGAKEIINDHLLAEAKRALQFSPRPIKEIAYDLNFATPEQFSHFFKKSTALSPEQYRTRFVEIGR